MLLLVLLIVVWVICGFDGVGLICVVVISAVGVAFQLLLLLDC